MEYRVNNPRDHGYADEEEQTYIQRSQIQYTMDKSGPDELLDSLLVIANVCEQRALMSLYSPVLAEWYTTVSLLVRHTLELCAAKPGGPRPQKILEDPFLYFPDVESTQ